jgi:hypothetical protein
MIRHCQAVCRRTRPSITADGWLLCAQARKGSTRMSFRPSLAAAAVLVGTALSLGGAVAHADSNDPAPVEVSADGQVRSEQAASVTGSQPCKTSLGTLGSGDVRSSDMGVPHQLAREAGPEWVGSDGWQAQGISRSNPWGGNFDPTNTHTGPACKPVTAGPFS